nr:unnamed protein product [Digitaria exilis]
MAGAAAVHHQNADDDVDGSDEWRVDVPNAVAEHQNARGARRACCRPALLVSLFSRAAAPVRRMVGFAVASWRWMVLSAAMARDRAVGLARTAWKIGADDPRKVAHGFKVALALTLCSVFYYVQPLYVFTGHNAMWAVLTVVVVFEAMATLTGGALALGVQWIASKSGKELEPFILSASVATYSRFIPTMKARFDYGVTIFILTYTLVAVGGYRVDEVVFMAQQRLTTIAIGAMICFAVCALISPVWAGQELHDQVARNMDKLAAAVESCVEDFFSEAAGVIDASNGEMPARRALSEKSQGYRAVLNAKASEDSLANLARWEPAHGHFGFRHPYPLYQKIGAAMRCCAYCVDALAASVGSETQAPAQVKKHLASASVTLSRHCAAVLREASGSVASMTRSGRLALAVGDMNMAAQELRDELRCLAALLEEDESSDTEHDQNMALEQAPPLIEVLPLFTAASLLLEICTRAEGVVSAVDNLATTGRFKKADSDEESALDVEAAVPVAMSATITVEVPQEAHDKVGVEHDKTETADDQSSDKSPGDQVGEVIKVLTRRRSTKKRARGDTKLCPKPPIEFAVHAPSPRSSRSMELTGHAPFARSPRHHHRSGELVGHPPVAPSPRNRSVDLANHGPVLPSPRNRSVDFTSHGPVLPSPRNRPVDFASNGSVLPSPRNRPVDFVNHGPVLPSPRHRTILGTA